MLLELIKEIDVEDRIWYNIKKDGSHFKAFLNEDEARKLFEKLKENVLKKSVFETLETYNVPEGEK